MNIKLPRLIFIELFCVAALCAQSHPAVSMQQFRKLPALPVAPDTLAVLLVEFDDVTHASFDSAGRRVPFDRVHRWRDFYNLLATRDFYNTERTGARSPEGEPVFGSFRDYFHDMSNGLYAPLIEIINDSTAEGIPRWVPLKSNKTQYFSTMHNWEAMYLRAVEQATLLGYDARVSPRRRICIIFAGNRRGKGGKLVGYCDASAMPRFFLASERWTYTGGENDFDEARHAGLTHIGLYCHEFTHMLGERHHGVYLWDIMGNGHKNNVDGRFGNCPAPIDPWFRARLGWLSFRKLPCDQPVLLVYGQDDQNYFLWSAPDSTQHLLFEYKRYHRGFDRGLPGRHAGQEGGLLVWKIQRDYIDLIEADGRSGEDNAVHDFFAADSPPFAPLDFGFPHSVTASRASGQSAGPVVESMSIRGDTLELRVKCP